MSLVFDVIIIVLFAATVIAGYKRGFFKSIMTFCSGIVSLIVAYTFSPDFSTFLNEKFFLTKISSSIADTIASIAKNGAESAQNAGYDLSKLLENVQFTNILERFGANKESVTQFINSTSDTSYDAVADLSQKIATPIAGTLSNVCAFMIIFVVALIVLRIITVVIGSIFKLPVLSTMDKLLGFIFGVVSAFLFVWIFALLVNTAISSFATIAPGVLDPNALENSVLLKFFANYNLFDLINNLTTK